MTVASVRASCGCTAATLDKTTYAPGEQGVVDVTFTFDGRTGPQVKYVTVTTAGPDPQEHLLTLTVDIPRSSIVNRESSSGPRARRPASASCMSGR